jgi:hypothetical protein
MILIWGTAITAVQDDVDTNQVASELKQILILGIAITAVQDDVDKIKRR